MAPPSQSQSLKYPPKKVGCFSGALVLCCVDFPIYYIESISERHVVIAGGGGSSKTGVHNQINILELIPTNDSCAAELVTKYETPKEIPNAIMTGSLMGDDLLTQTRFVTGDTNSAIIYNLDYKTDSKSYAIDGYKIFRSSKVEAEIKCVKYVSDGRIFTGGVDGQLAVWDSNKTSDDLVERTLKKHTKEIDEIDINLITGQVVTLSRGECRFVIWNLSNLEPLKEFKKDSINKESQNQTSNINYNYRSCRFVYNTTNPTATESYLLVACNPTTSRAASVIYKWNTKGTEFSKSDCKPVTMDGIMSIDISKDGRYFAIGTRSGGVAIFDTKYIRQVYKLDNAHRNAVTGLEFLPPKRESLTLTNSELNPLLSISIDRQVILHRPRKRSTIFKLFKMFFLAIIIFATFVIMHHYYIKDTIVIAHNETVRSHVHTNDSQSQSIL